MAGLEVAAREVSRAAFRPLVESGFENYNKNIFLLVIVKPLHYRFLLVIIHYVLLVIVIWLAGGRARGRCAGGLGPGAVLAGQVL